MCVAGRMLSDPQVSPDGATAAMVATAGGRSSVVLVPTDGGAEAVLGGGPAPARGWGVLAWTPDGRSLVHVGADRRLHLRSVTGGPSRCLAGTEGAAAPTVSPDGRRVAFAASMAAVGVASLVDGGPWPLRASAPVDFCVDPAWSPDGATVLWHQWQVPAMSWDHSTVSVVSLEAVAEAARRGDPVPPPVAVALPSPVAVAQPRVRPGGGELGFLCDAGGWLNLWSARLDGSAAEPLVAEASEHAGPTWGPGDRTWAWSPDGTRAAFTRNQAGFGELCIVDLASRPGAAPAVAVVDRGVFTGLSWAGERLVALRSGARTPDQVVAYDTSRPVDTGPADRGESADRGEPTGGGAPRGQRRRALARGPVLGMEASVVEPEVVSWEGPDVADVGREVHGRLWRAPLHAGAPSAAGDVAGAGAGPLLVWVHGGPTGQHRVAFSFRTAFLLDRGWSILQVDPRGSTGWGRPYTQALAGRWGRTDVDDTVAALQAAGPRGWGDPTRLALMGASSAGLTVLLTMAAHPGLVAAGIDLYGVVDLFALHAGTHRLEAHYTPLLVGALPDAASEWRDRSPLAHASQITDPVLVLHGSADPVVPAEQSEQLVAALRAAGTIVEHHLYSGEGHGWSRSETVVDELDRIEAFLTRHVLRGHRP